MYTIFLFVVEAIACNSKVYSWVDHIYAKFTMDFQQSAVDSGYYNHHIIKEKSIIQEEYAKKALGILSFIMRHLNPDDEHYKVFSEWLKELFRRGWAYEDTYVKRHNVINLGLYRESLIKKRRGVKNISSTTMFNSSAVLLFLAVAFRIEIDMDDELFKLVIQIMNNRLNVNYLENMDNVRDDIALKIKSFDKDLNSLNCNVNTFDGIIDATSKYIPEEIVGLILSSNAGISLTDVLNNCTLSKNQLEANIYTSLITMEKVGQQADLRNPNFILAFLYNTVVTMFANHYKEMKEFHNSTSEYKTIYELEKSKYELKECSDELVKVKNENEKLKIELEKQHKEIKLLKNKMDTINTNKAFLEKQINTKLNLNNEIVDQNIIEYDIETVKGFHGLIVGGHPKWQEKMKEKLRKSIFLSPDDLNFDLNLINNADFICIDTKYNSHSLYEKIIDRARKLNKRVIYMPQNTNRALNINYIYKNLIA